DVVGWRIDDVVALIRGKKDTVVRLEILPADAGLDGKHELVTLVRDKINLDLFWLKDESLEDSADLPDPDVIAQEIADDLQTALEQFAAISAKVKRS
ncbi:MAG TPA: hypothetical protein PK867_26485, partial [Pirellulales bacterium]|nr:hypothetical protein [Pirellulales bacterium]